MSNASALQATAPHEFETLICRLYREIGYEVEQTRAARDHGRDALMRLNGDLILLEVKRYNNSRAGRPELQKLHSAMITDGAKRAVFVSLGGFSKDAVRFADSVGIQLIELPDILDLMRQAGWSGSSTTQYAHLCENCGKITTLELNDEEGVRCPCGATISNRLMPYHVQPPAKTPLTF